MSKLIENKQIIHIATEIIVILGVTFYFSSKNKKLLEHIEDLSQRLEEQEDLIQKHEQIIKQLVNAINSQNSVQTVVAQKQQQTHNKYQQKTKHPKSQSPLKLPTPPKAQSPPKSPKSQSSDGDISESTSDLDDEIQEELADLGQPSKQNLKKRI